MMSSLLTACAQERFNQDTQLQIVLPHIPEYKQSVMNAAADEVASLSCPALTEFAKDYKVMRDRLRILKK